MQVQLCMSLNHKNSWIWITVDIYKAFTCSIVQMFLMISSSFPLYFPIIKTSSTHPKRWLFSKRFILQSQVVTDTENTTPSKKRIFAPWLQVSFTLWRRQRSKSAPTNPNPNVMNQMKRNGHVLTGNLQLCSEGQSQICWVYFNSESLRFHSYLLSLLHLDLKPHW